ncbi:MAG: RsmB/NOP family class I SAM-dependent RNA methyltransferase [Parvularculaceae bacterium]
MRDSGRVSAAIAILEDFDRRRVPLKTAIADWARNARYAGAKDRAWISGLCLDVMRRRASLGATMSDSSPRAATLAALRLMWRRSEDEVEYLASEEPHGPGGLTEVERDRLRLCAPAPAENERNLSLSVLGDFPEWMESSVERVFGARALEEMRALSSRADVDLRINTLQAPVEKALSAISKVGAEAHPFVRSAARIPAPDPAKRAPAVTIIPAFNKGWVEVQDLASQISACASGDVKGAQVLDFCAGGGGKTLALAAMMENMGQLYAYDIDARRFKPLYDRARRAGVRNLQIINPASDAGMLEALAGKMDVAFVDAPCTGSGTWRRHPDAKWRLREDQLKKRLEEQDNVLNAAAQFVKPGGRLVYATCSFLMEENEDRLSVFRTAHPEFEPVRALDSIDQSGLLAGPGRDALKTCETQDGALRITPARIGADGFYVSVMTRKR